MKTHSIKLSSIYGFTILCFLSCQAEDKEYYKSPAANVKATDKKIVTEAIHNSSANSVYFDFKIIKGAKNQDERVGTDSEIEVYLKIEDQLVDTYTDFGVPEYGDSKKELYLSSELLEKTYMIAVENDTKIRVTRLLFCSDCEIQESETEWVYTKTNTGQWKLSSCTGDCNL